MKINHFIELSVKFLKDLIKMARRCDHQSVFIRDIPEDEIEFINGDYRRSVWVCVKCQLVFYSFMDFESYGSCEGCNPRTLVDYKKGE